LSKYYRQQELNFAEVFLFQFSFFHRVVFRSSAAEKCNSVKNMCN